MSNSILLVNSLKMLTDAFTDASTAISNLYEALRLLHIPISFSGKGNHIVKVICSCGEVTEFKVPLRDLDDFKCPKKENR